MLPVLPDRYGWRNPVIDYDYVRTIWELYRSEVCACETLATITLGSHGFVAELLGAGEALTYFDPADAFADAAEYAQRLAAEHGSEKSDSQRDVT